MPAKKAKIGKAGIETLKWKWAKEVKNPGVYRDEEFVRNKTKAGALKTIDHLMGQAAGITYTITVRKDTKDVEGDWKYYTYFRHSMPCLGGLVKYRDSHGERYFMNPYFPRDIYVAYPEGKTIFVACHRQNMKQSLSTPYFEFLLSPESPWVSAFGSKDSIIFKDNYFVLTNMDTDPTVFYSLWRTAGFSYHCAPGHHDPKAILLSTKQTECDPRRLAGQKPIRISGGTWAEGFGYTRPYNESIFKTKLPHKFKDLGSTSKSGYPNAPHDNSYFIKTMKDKFGVDASSLINLAKSEKALVEAWDYFKEESKKLDE
jgi:hypothetical protein